MPNKVISPAVELTPDQVDRTLDQMADSFGQQLRSPSLHTPPEFVLAPQLDSGLLLATMFAAMIALAGWFAIKGIDIEKWPDWPLA